MHFLGQVPSPTLADVLERADVCVNLRYPTFEGASASTLEQMAHGRPTIVFEVGWYDELPDDAVVKVPHTIDPTSLAAEIERLLLDPDERQQIGNRARLHAATGHDARAYAERLVTFLDGLDAGASLMETATAIADLTRSWGMSPRSPLAERTARRLMEMLGPPGG
jgi:glycosyltransferase involved in cell wall biosynthesis